MILLFLKCAKRAEFSIKTPNSDFESSIYLYCFISRLTAPCLLPLPFLPTLYSVIEKDIATSLSQVSWQGTKNGCRNHDRTDYWWFSSVLLQFAFWIILKQG